MVHEDLFNHFLSMQNGEALILRLPMRGKVELYNISFFDGNGNQQIDSGTVKIRMIAARPKDGMRVYCDFSASREFTNDNYNFTRFLEAQYDRITEWVYKAPWDDKEL